jgi:hypothetical protein
MDTEVTVTDEVRQGEAMTTTRSRLLLIASQSALTQTIGNRISAESIYGLQAHNKDVDERLLHRIRSQAAGFVKQQVIDEKIDTQSGRQMLRLRVKAAVCVPRTPLLVKEAVRVTTAVNIKGEEAREFKEALLDVFSGSPNFVISDDPDESVDMEIDGSIDRIEWAGTGKSLSVDFPAKTVPASPTAPTDIQRLSVGITVHARRIDDNTIVTVVLNQSKNFPPAADPARVAPSYVRDMLKQAAVELHDKVTELKAQELSPSTKVPARPKSVEW